MRKIKCPYCKADILFTIEENRKDSKEMYGCCCCGDTKSYMRITKFGKLGLIKSDVLYHLEGKRIIRSFGF